MWQHFPDHQTLKTDQRGNILHWFSHLTNSFGMSIHVQSFVSGCHISSGWKETWFLILRTGNETMTGDKLITYWDDCGNRGEKCSLDSVFIVSSCWSPDVVIPFTRFSLHLVNCCSSRPHVYRTGLCYSVYSYRGIFIITKPILIICSCFFSHWDFLPHFFIVLLSLCFHLTTVVFNTAG